MKKIFLPLLTCSLFLCSQLKAQQQSAINLDGTDDVINVPGASALIAGANTQLSVSCWVFPNNGAPAFPDFDGFIGFRNEIDADFYLLQIGTNEVEARIRTNTGVTTITYTGLQLATWQHFVLTYDGAQLIMYKNGIIVASDVASGDITNTSADLAIGNLLYQTTNFYLNGSVDEASLWSKALSASEVNCIYKSPINITSVGLKLYYNFNEGIANGNNTLVTEGIDQTGNINASISNFALTGNTSNWVNGVINYTPLTATICQGDTYSFNGLTLDSTGIYSAIYTASASCDSVVILDLAVNVGPSNTSITQNIDELHSNQDSATYQWIHCNPNSNISGAISQNYMPTSAGSYAVILTKNGCTITTPCVNYVPSGINSITNETLLLSPNPATDFVTLSLGNKRTITNVIVFDITGKELINTQMQQTSVVNLDTKTLNKGVYFLQVTSNNQKFTAKFIIQ